MDNESLPRIAVAVQVKLMAKTILCYGDSNTWGATPNTLWPLEPTPPERYPADIRWPGRLRTALGDGYLLIEEGLNGRTTIWDDPFDEFLSGKTYLLPCLKSHQPLDLVILMLGTNDLKAHFANTAHDVSRGLTLLIDLIQQSATGPGGNKPAILILTPPHIRFGANPDTPIFFAGAEEKSTELASLYSAIADTRGCSFIDTATFVAVSDKDGLHLSSKGHAALANGIIEIILCILAGK